MGPLIGALAASAFKGIFDTVQTGFQNRYNSPVQQLRRLRKAGLPLAYMYQGRVNQQSDAPKLSIDPTIGTAQQIGLHQQDEVNKAQIRKIGAEVVGKNIENKKASGELKWLLEDSGLEPGRNNQNLNLDLKQGIDYANKFVADHKNQLTGIAVDIANATKQTEIEQKKKELRLTGQKITNMLSQNKLLGQLYNIRQVEEQVNDMIDKYLEEGGDFATGLYALILKLFSKI